MYKNKSILYLKDKQIIILLIKSILSYLLLLGYEDNILSLGAQGGQQAPGVESLHKCHLKMKLKHYRLYFPRTVYLVESNDKRDSNPHHHGGHSAAPGKEDLHQCMIP